MKGLKEKPGCSHLGVQVLGVAEELTALREQVISIASHLGGCLTTGAREDCWERAGAYSGSKIKPTFDLKPMTPALEQKTLGWEGRQGWRSMG